MVVPRLVKDRDCRPGHLDQSGAARTSPLRTNVSTDVGQAALMLRQLGRVCSVVTGGSYDSAERTCTG